MSEQQKWRVEKRDRWIIGTYWTAFQGDKEWFDPTPMFPTWAEAMRYADEQARTITVTLPRDPDAREVAQAGKWASWKGNGWAITSNDPERAALNILAHARKEQHRG